MTREEEAMLAGEFGEATRRAMEMLVGVGKAFDAEGMVEISMVHIPGASIVSSKDIGLEFTEEMCKIGGRCRVPTTLNPSAIDHEGDKWKALKIPEECYEKQTRYTNTFRAMGAITNHTCTPYLVGMIPTLGEHISWGEATAQAFVSGIFGARTNLTSGPEALAASIAGRVPLYGLHLAENRLGNVLIKVEAKLERVEDFGVASHYYLKNFGQYAGMNWVPVWSGLRRRPSADEFKGFCPGSMFHVLGYTPEARTVKDAFGGDTPKETITIDDAIIRETYEDLCEGPRDGPVDFVMTGCPFASITEIGKVANLLRGRKIHRDVHFWVCTSYQVKKLADRMDYTSIIEGAGAIMVSDTCPALAPMHEIAKAFGCETCATNNRMSEMIRARAGIKISYFGTLGDIVDAAITGKWGGKH